MERIRQVFPVILLAAALGWILSWFCLSGTVAAAPKKASAAANVKNQSCTTCHSDSGAMVPKGHPPVKGTDISSCTPCHQPDRSGKAEANKFSTRIHMAHVNAGGAVNCTLCHEWQPGERFGLRGAKDSWGKPAKEDMDAMKEIMASWGTGPFMDALHAKANVACGSCHGSAAPKLDDKLDNARCLSCHGPMDKLAAKSAPKDFPERNPHKSHLGEINCTVCHKAHAASVTYCLDCHKQFRMNKIPGGENKK